MASAEPDNRPANGPFAGIRVLELATGIAGPYTAMFLADQGADVVKVEAPGGDPYRTDPGFQTVNRNKRSVVVDSADLVAGAEALAPSADVIIVDRPGRADRLRALNPAAVILTMPPWGERGPKVDDPTGRTLLHAATGIAWNQQSYGEVPVDVVVPVASYGAGVLGALAAASGLLARRSRGVAPTYEVSEVAGAAAMQLGEFRLDGDTAPRPGDSGLGSKGRVACYRLIEAGDGKWLFLACGTARFYERMLDVIGRPELIDDPDLANPPWGLMLDEAIARITPILDEVFATRPRDEWLQLLAEADVPAQPVLTREEFLETSIVEANAMDVAVDHPELGEIRMMGLPVTVESAPGAVARPAPTLGQHTAEVAADWGDRRDRLEPAAEGLAAERPLAGLRVIDLSSFIAGPVVSRHLAMLGADVIKVEAPSGDPFRAIGPMFLSWNQGKRSIVIDLRTEEGQAELHRLVADADAVIENFRPGVSARLGCDEPTLRAVNPNLVFLSSPGYGLDETMAARAAFDPLAQALGGFMAAQGGVRFSGDGNEPVFLTVPVHDVTTPIVGAFGVVAGWWQRGRSAAEGGGGGQHVRTSLIQSTMVAQAAEYTRYAGRPEAALGGFDHPGQDGDTWHENDAGDLIWCRGDDEVPVETHGLTASELAAANGLSVTQPSTAFGDVTVFGQLVVGAGPPPSPCPDLGQHSDEIRAELAAG
jgi:crotonobetainyl-CoA:carnitine CoA-transferase CaiB-like acyl-CoA transferase